MKSQCDCCGKAAPMFKATPVVHAQYRIHGETVEVTANCVWCGGHIYRISENGEDADWLHLRTDARSCDAEV